MTFLQISWWIGFIDSIITTIGSVYFVKSVEGLTPTVKTREALIYLGFTSILVIAITTIVFVFGLIELSITNTLWILFPITCVALAISWAMGSYKLNQFTKELAGVRRDEE